MYGNATMWPQHTMWPEPIILLLLPKQLYIPLIPLILVGSNPAASNNNNNGSSTSADTCSC